MNNIVAGTTERLTVIDSISELGVILPRLNMVNDNRLFSDKVITVLTPKVISSYTKISPFFIKYAITPFLIATKIILSVLSFGKRLFGSGRFITALTRTKTPRFSVIWEHPVWSKTAFTVFELTHHSKNVNMEKTACQTE